MLLSMREKRVEDWLFAALYATRHPALRVIYTHALRSPPTLPVLHVLIYFGSHIGCGDRPPKSIYKLAGRVHEIEARYVSHQ